MFWDKLEKSNYFLESIISTHEMDWNSRLVMHLLSDPIQDGGQWDMWINLVDKYGVVPQSEMPESFSSSNSRVMNKLITRRLRENAMILRTALSKGMVENDVQALKNEMLLIEKGSICINGVSLTVFDIVKNTFKVTIIPYTYENTSFKKLKEGDIVNIEFDMIGKYLARFNK